MRGFNHPRAAGPHERSMNMRSRLMPLITVLGLFFTLGGLSPLSWGQKNAPPAPTGIAPQLAMPMPLGIQRGTTLDMLLTGSNLANPTGVLVGFPAKVTIPEGDKNGQDNAKFKVRLEVPADVPLGYYPLRVAATGGMSNLRVFCVD